MYRRCDKATHFASVGLIFDEGLTYVLLERKARPDWLAGFLVGPGGKIEPGEGPLDCVHREIREETGLAPKEFALVVRLHQTTPTHPYLITYFYRATLPLAELAEVTHNEENRGRDEPLYLLRYDEVYGSGVYSNERYIIQLAHSMLVGRSRATFLDIYEQYESAHERFGGGY